MKSKKQKYVEIARLYGKNESSIREVMKNKEKIRDSFSVAPQTAKVTAIAPNKVLMKVEKALNFWLEDMNRKRAPLDSKVLRQKALSYTRTFKRKKERNRKPSLLQQTEDGCIGLGTGLV